MERQNPRWQSRAAPGFTNRTLAERFPELAEINGKCREIDYGYCSPGGPERFITPATREWIECHNPSCVVGGHNIGSTIKRMIEDRAVEYSGVLWICHGMKSGSGGSMHCWGRLDGEIHIAYLQSP